MILPFPDIFSQLSNGLLATRLVPNNTGPPKLEMALPLGAELLAKVLFVIFTVPLLLRRPPTLELEPWATVRALRMKVTPLSTDSTCTLSPPERVTCCPLPSRVRFLLIVSVAVRVIVPLQANLMVSPLDAFLMALRRVASSQVLTVLVAAGWAWAVLLVSPRLASTPTPSSRASPTRRAQDERWMVCFQGANRQAILACLLLFLLMTLHLCACSPGGSSTHGFHCYSTLIPPPRRIVPPCSTLA